MNKLPKTDEPKPVSGWVCVAVGVGFLAFFVAAIASIIVVRGG